MRKRVLTVFSIVFILSLPALAISSDGVNSCGYEMIAVPAAAAPGAMSDIPPSPAPAILDAWTTNDPFVNPYNEVYQFTRGVDTLAFVVEYVHAGGAIPEQFARGWRCENETQINKTCRFKWTVGYLPPGTYLLINYMDPVKFGFGQYDWASKVGNVVFGWPDPASGSRPWCFAVVSPD
jgi:hypothetical protein